jgi:hypothetical protein
MLNIWAIDGVSKGHNVEGGSLDNVAHYSKKAECEASTVILNESS